MFQWTPKSDAALAAGGVIGPDERLPWPQTAMLGVQHLIAMFGATVLAPILMGFSPKFGALIQAIPLAVMGGVSIVVFGLIAVAGAKIWVDNRVDFSDNKNLLVAAITLVLGTGDFTLKFGDFALGGIGTATFGAIGLYALLNRRRSA
jgi:putative pyrimidine permease RutG